MLLLGFSRACRSSSCSRRCRRGCVQDGIQRDDRNARLGRYRLLDQVPVGAGRRSHKLPLLHRLFGRLAQLDVLAQAVAIGLLNLSLSDPSADVCASPCGPCSSPSARRPGHCDRCVAHRVRAARDAGAMAAAYQLGYRSALIAGSAGALTVAAGFGWQASYTTMAALVAVGVITTLASREPEAGASRDTLLREERVIAWLDQRTHWLTGCATPARGSSAQSSAR